MINSSFMRTSCIAVIGVGFVLAVTGQAQSSPVGDGDKSDKQDEREATPPRVYSGLQVGEKTRPFRVLSVKDGETEEVEIVKDAGERVTLICFVHKLSNDDRILYGLGLVDFYGRRHKNLDSHIVLLNDDRPKITRMLQGWSRIPIFKNSLVSLSVDGMEGPGYYGLNRHVAMTVLVVKGDCVASNLVFQAPNGNDLQAIMESVAKALDQPKPTMAKLQEELRAERQRIADQRMKASPEFQLAPNEQLGRVMYGMVNARGNRSQNATRRSKQLVAWAGDSEQRKTVLRNYCEAILAGMFRLNQYSRTALEEIVEN